VVLLLAGVAVFAALDFYESASASNRVDQDVYKISAQEPRFAAVAAVVAPSETLGYVSDLETSTTAGAAVFLGAQYALAPRLLVPLAKVEPGQKVVGNFSRPPYFPDLDVTLERDFGGGVYLLRKEGD
jgi:hypothetical protein